jgi:hypothetical protein
MEIPVKSQIPVGGRGVPASFPASIVPRCVALALLTVAPLAPVCAQDEAAQSPQTTFVFFQRTHSHEMNSTTEIFKQVVDDIEEYLKKNHVGVVMDADVSYAGGQVPLFAVQQMARDSKAAYLLYVVVDRPPTKWLKVTVRCDDAKGQQVWQEQVDSGRAWANAKAIARGTQNALQNLHEELSKRLGQPGLPQVTLERLPPSATAAQSPNLPAVPIEDTAEFIRLADGTPVRLLLSESVSSKSAKVGDKVKLQVLDDVKAGDLVIIADKAPATATIETAKSAGRAWRAGNLVLKLNSVALINHQDQPLRAWSANRGKDTGAVFAWIPAIIQSDGLALFVLPFAPLQHGNQATLPRGTLLEAVIDGDISLPRADLEANQPKPSEPGHGPASVTIYNRLPAGTVDIWCGRVKVARLGIGHKFTMNLPAAKYWLGIWKGGLDTPLDAQDGGDYYVSVNELTDAEVRMQRNVRSFVQVSVVPHDVGELQAADMVAAKLQDVKDVRQLDPGLLQAGPHAKKK